MKKIVGVLAINRKALISYIRGFSSLGYLPKSDILSLTMVCGRVYNFKTYKNLPHKTKECACGEETVIEYTTKPTTTRNTGGK